MDSIDKNPPLLTVLMSVYNEPIGWLHESIDSILNQTYSAFEFIIVNDNPSRAELKELLNTYQNKDSRIVIVDNETNIGLTKSLNKGLAIVKGKYIARMDADDISLPQRFEKQIQFMQAHPSVIVCGTQIKRIGSKTKSFPVRMKCDSLSIKAEMLFDSSLVHPSVIIRKSVLDDNKLRYDEEYKQAQDYRLWEQLYDFGDFANLDELLLLYRISALQITSRKRSYQRNYAVLIRKRLMNKWLQNMGVNIVLPEQISFATISSLRNLVVKKVQDEKQSVFFSQYMRVLYFVCKSGNFKSFLFAIYTMDIFKFSFKGFLIYLLVLLHLKNKPIEW